MRKMALLTIVLLAVVACGSEVAATGPAGVTDSQVQPTSTPTVQATATTAIGQPSPVAVIEEQRIKDLEFRVAEMERLLSAGDGMFSVTDDLSQVDGRLRAQQRCINALVLAAREHQHRSDVAGGESGPPQFRSFDSFGLDATLHAMMVAVECGPAVDESLIAALADDYGIDPQ